MSVRQRIRRPPSALRSLKDSLQLAKPKVTGLSLLTVAAGFLLPDPAGFAPGRLGGTIFFTLLAAAGAGALNQYLDRDSDSLMGRTSPRPLPARRISPAAALAAGAVLSAAGTVCLGIWIGRLSALLAGLTLLVYLAVYTPLKKKTWLSIWPGALVGALPPLIGWSAAGAGLDIRALSLSAILFFWQIPHFLAISWIRRREYARAGLPVLATLDPAGIRASRQAVLHSALLLAASLVPFFTGLSGRNYLYAAAALGTVVLFCALLLRLRRSERRARLLLAAGVAYLPCLLLLMLLDRAWR
jgi:protoheme IX farnesyltransferase